MQFQSLCDCFFSIACFAAHYKVFFAFEQLADGPTDMCIVIDDQDGLCHVLRGPLRVTLDALVDLGLFSSLFLGASSTLLVVWRVSLRILRVDFVNFAGKLLYRKVR